MASFNPQPEATPPGQQPTALESVLDHIQEAVGSFDHEWRVVYLNRAALELCDRPATELLGRIVWEIFPRAVGTMFYSKLHQVAADGQRRKFEERHPVLDQWLEAEAYPDGQRLIVIIRDITEARKRAIADRDRDERLRLALSAGKMGIWEYDLLTRRLQLSPELEALYGMALGAFDGTPESASALIHPEDLPGLAKAVAEAIEQRGALTHEFRWIGQDGSLRYLHSRAKVICNELGEAVTMIGVTRDITDQRVAALELDSKFGQLQLLSRLAGAVSRAQEPGEIYRAAVECLVRAVGADRASMRIFDTDEVLRFKAWVGLSDEYRAAVEGSTRWRRGSTDTSPIAVPDVQQEPSLFVYRDALAKEGIHSMAFIPLMGKGGLIGKFMLYYNQQHDFQPEALQIAQTIATNVALAAEHQYAETALRGSEQLFRAIFTQAAVGIAQVGIDGRFLLLNDRFCEILGYTQAELLGRSFQEVTYPDDRPAAGTIARQLLTGEIQSHTREKRYVRKDGAIVWARLYASLVRDQNDGPEYYIAVVEDVTDRVQAERALRDSEGNLALAESAAHLGVWNCDLSADQIVISQEFARLRGLLPDRHRLTQEEWLALIHPVDRERVRVRLRESVETTHVWDDEFRVVWPDGSVHWLLGKGKVYLDDSGRPVRMAGVSLDITGRKQTEGALAESEERFRNMADTAPVMIWVAGPDKVLNFFNKTWLDFVGRSLEQELNNGWVESLHPDDVKRCFAGYSSSFDARENFHIECRMRRADGEYRWVLCSGVPRFAPGGVFAGYIGSDIDITDLRRAQEEAFERQKLESMSVLTGGIAHDFNNLLGSILVDAELAEADLAEGSSPGDQIQRIKAVTIRAAEIVRELMIYSGQDKADLEPVDLSRLVEDMLELFKVSISKNAVLKTGFAKNLPAVRGNAAQIRQIVMNLIINASEAMGDKYGVIEVTTSLAARGMNLPEGEYLVLQVSDTGRGMTEEQKARVFEPFFTTKFAGRGLGLAVVQGIVRAHHGVIQLASAPGLGTTFQILLPCAEAPAELQPATAPTLEDEPSSRAAGTVLLVEDEDMLRLSVSKMLRRRGFSVVEAGDGSAAVDRIRTHRHQIDVIVLDVTIPGTSSREVVAEARRTRPDVKVILTSAYSRETVMPSVDEPGVSAFIRKPFPLADLVELLRKTLASAG